MSASKFILTSGKVTVAQSAALKWICDRNKTGAFGNDGVLIAAGERAPVMRSTWNALRDGGAVSIVGKRLTVIEHEKV